MTATASDAGPTLSEQAAAIEHGDWLTNAYGGRKSPVDPNDICEPADVNLTRAEKEILAAPRGGASSIGPAWDKKTPPQYLDIVDRRFALTTGEKAMLRANGFVVPARLAVRGYADALHDVYQSQLPIFVSADAILHAVYKGNDVVMIDTERSLLAPLSSALATMAATLPQLTVPAEVRSDLTTYLEVAQALIGEEPSAGEKSGFQPHGDAIALVEKAQAAKGLMSEQLFGRTRMIDWSQYQPRGHYTNDSELERWFKGTMWLSRLEFNLVSRKSRSSQPGIVPNPEETPREAVDAIALATLAEAAGTLDTLDKVEQAWSEFAGKREDVSIRDLLALKKKAGITTLTIPDSAEKLKAAIGNDFQRTTRIHYMPQGSMPLPAIATMLGPRIVPDSQAETNLVHATVDGRAMPSFADVTFMLGSDRAKTYLAKDLATFSDLKPELEKGRGIMTGIPATNLYGAWLGSIREIATKPAGVSPSFTSTTAYEDFKINTTVAAYGQLRHNYVLIAGQAYDEGGCEIPDGYIEPALPLYESLRKYAERGELAMKTLGASDASVKYFGRLKNGLDVIIRITKDELAGNRLTDAEKRWLAMASEIVPPSSDGPGSNDGWYFQLFANRYDAFADHAFIADWFTSSNAHAVVYAGAREPRMGIFVVDTNGAPRVMVGPVARACEHVGSLDGRLQDRDAGKIGELREPWAASYTARAVPFPPLQIVSLSDGGYAVRSSAPIGKITLELLGHHRTVIGKASAFVGTNWTVLQASKGDPDEWASLLRVRSAENSAEFHNNFGYVMESINMPDIGWETADKVRQKLSKSE
jgi:hypothetical protein